jgi:hypothetical protein
MKRGALGVGDWARQGYFGTAGTGHERVRDRLACGLAREGTTSMLPCMTWKGVVGIGIALGTTGYSKRNQMEWYCDAVY